MPPSNGVEVPKEPLPLQQAEPALCDRIAIEVAAVAHGTFDPMVIAQILEGSARVLAALVRLSRLRELGHDAAVSFSSAFSAMSRAIRCPID